MTRLKPSSMSRRHRRDRSAVPPRRRARVLLGASMLACCASLWLSYGAHATCQWWTGPMIGCEEPYKDYTVSQFFMELEKAADMGNVAAVISVGDDAYKFGHYAKAMEWYKKALAQGDNSRLLRVAEMYETGRGVAADTWHARELYRRAISALSWRASSNQWTAFDIAVLYRDGKGTPVDTAKAAQFFQIAVDKGNVTAMAELGTIQVRAGQHEAGIANLQAAADQGNTSAMTKLGDIYYAGIVVPQDYARALQLYEQAADAGDLWELVEIGNMYANGQGTATDPARAAQWWSKAVAELPSIAGQYPYIKLVLAGLYREGKGVAKDEARAARLTEEAADAGDASAQGMLALNAGTDARSRLLALKWTRSLVNSGNQQLLEHMGDLLQQQGQAAEAGAYWRKAAAYYESVAGADPRSARRAGLMYRVGKGVAQDTTAAIRLLSIAAKQGDADAQQALGEIYYAAGPATYELALAWLESSAKAGNVWVLEPIGDMYANGRGTPRDPAMAQDYWSRAAAVYQKDSATSPWSRYSLGTLYASGRGVPRDIVRARQLLTSAREAGVGQAQAALAKLDAAILNAAN
jgi:TPR repeat protein